jgi:hypothetical protein
VGGDAEAAIGKPIGIGRPVRSGKCRRLRGPKQNGSAEAFQRYAAGKSALSLRHGRIYFFGGN